MVGYINVSGRKMTAAPREQKCRKQVNFLHFFFHNLCSLLIMQCTPTFFYISTSVRSVIYQNTMARDIIIMQTKLTY